MGIGPYGLRARRRGLRDEIMVITPFEGIVSDVFHPNTVVLFITDNVIVIGPLPNGSAQFFCDQDLPGTNQRRYIRCRRGRCPHRPFPRVIRRNVEDQMYMVGHDHIFPYPGDIPEMFFHHPANGGKGELRADVGISTYGCGGGRADVGISPYGPK